MYITLYVKSLNLFQNTTYLKNSSDGDLKCVVQFAANPIAVQLTVTFPYLSFLKGEKHINIYSNYHYKLCHSDALRLPFLEPVMSLLQEEGSIISF